MPRLPALRCDKGTAGCIRPRGFKLSWPSGSRDNVLQGGTHPDKPTARGRLTTTAISSNLLIQLDLVSWTSLASGRVRTGGKTWVDPVWLCAEVGHSSIMRSARDDTEGRPRLSKPALGVGGQPPRPVGACRCRCREKKRAQKRKRGADSGSPFSRFFGCRGGLMLCDRQR
jgi:hypothetical protein